VRVADRPYHHGNLRAELVEQAEKTLREQGLDGLSLRELARQIGVSHAAPRRHFPDRQALLDALAEAGFERLGAQLREAAVGEDFESRLRAIATTYARFATDDAALLELMFAGKLSEQGRTLHEAADRAFAVILELIQEGQAAGLIEPGEPERVALLLFATLQGIAALTTAGVVASEQLDDLVADATARFVSARPSPLRGSP
jgi:AcrR family transcriptional regulator